MKIAGTNIVLFAVTKAGDQSGTKHDIKNDIRSFEVTQEMGEMLTTGLDETNHTRLQTILDSKFSVNGIVNTTANRSHDVLKVLRGIRAVDITVATGIGWSGNYVQMSYNMSRTESGELSFTAEFVPTGPVTVK